MTLVDFLGWAAALSTFAAFSMKTMLPLRVAAIIANLFFIGYGALSGLLPVLALHALLLPFNLLRLIEILRLKARARARQEAPGSLDWLRSAMRPRDYAAGASVFRQGDPPMELFYLDRGRVRLDEIDVVLEPGEIFGEIAFFSDQRARTLSATCLTPCRILTLDEAGFLSLYYRNPELGLTIVKLVTRRLMNGMRTKPGAYVAADAMAGTFNSTENAPSGTDTIPNC